MTRLARPMKLAAAERRLAREVRAIFRELFDEFPELALYRPVVAQVLADILGCWRRRGISPDACLRLARTPATLMAIAGLTYEAMSGHAHGDTPCPMQC